MVERARARAGALDYGSPGIGFTPHLTMELFKSVAGIDDVTGSQLEFDQVSAVTSRATSRSPQTTAVHRVDPPFGDGERAAPEAWLAVAQEWETFSRPHRDGPARRRSRRRGRRRGPAASAA